MTRARKLVAISMLMLLAGAPGCVWVTVQKETEYQQDRYVDKLLDTGRELRVALREGSLPPAQDVLDALGEPDAEVSAAEYPDLYFRAAGKRLPEGVMERLYNDFCRCNYPPMHPRRTGPVPWRQDDRFAALTLWIYDVQTRFDRPLDDPGGRWEFFQNLVCAIEDGHVAAAGFHWSREAPGLAAEGRLCAGCESK